MIEAAPPAPSPEMKLAWEERLVRLYQLALGPGRKTDLKASRCAHLLIGVTGTVQADAGSAGANAAHGLKAGEYLFFGPGHHLQVDNRGSESAACVLLELQ